MEASRISKGSYCVKVKDMTFYIECYGRNVWQIYSDNEDHSRLVNGDNDSCTIFETFREAKQYLFNTLERFYK